MFVFWICCFWFACGILSGLIADYRKLDFVKFFFIGLLTGLLGIVLALVINPVPASEKG